jgi:Ti type entry exclusion protein TrbK
VAVILAMGVATTVFISLRSSDRTVASDPGSAATSTDTDKHRRAEQFFGGDPDRDIRGGQEMKPRW